MRISLVEIISRLMPLSESASKKFGYAHVGAHPAPDERDLADLVVMVNRLELKIVASVLQCLNDPRSVFFGEGE